MGNIGKFRDTDTDIEGSNDSTKQKAGYLATRLSLAEKWHAVLGSRYGSWKTDSNYYSFNDQYQRTGNDHSSQTQNDVFTPYAGLLYDITPEYTAYVSYTDIFKPQTERDSSRKYLDPIVGQNYELELKGSLLDERLNVAAVFWSKQGHRRTG